MQQKEVKHKLQKSDKHGENRHCNNVTPDSIEWERENSPAQVTIMGNIIRTTTYAHQPIAPPITRISKDEYIDHRFGEVFTYTHGNGSRDGNAQSLWRTMQAIRDTVNAAAPDASRVRWVTLTYAENMTDTQRLYRDAQAYTRRLYAYCAKRGYSRPEWITVPEPQGRGAWHLHALYIWRDKAPFIPNADLRALWKQGFVKIIQPQDCDNIGAYLSAYLTDMPPDDDGRKHKGARLHLYPAGMRLLRTSRGIDRPAVIRTDYAEAKKYVDALTPTYETSGIITDTEGQTIQQYHTTYYNKHRRK